LNFTTPAGQADWQVALTTGRGICPHRGKQYGEEVSGTAGPLVLVVHSTDLMPAADEFLPTGDPPDPLVDQYFVHLKPQNPTEHLGESVSYTFKVFLLNQ